MYRTLTIKVTRTNGTIEILSALASAINEVRRDMEADPTVAKWEVEC
jgi:hypothetical protein